MARVYPYELIGQEIEVVRARNKSNLGLQGRVVDETKYTLRILHQGKTKTLLKNNIAFKLKKNALVLEGKNLALRPEERLKGK